MDTATQAVTDSKSLSYPHEIEVTLKLKFRITDPEERDYYLTPTGDVTPGLIADTMDGFLGYGNELLLAVNDKTVIDAQAALNNTGKW
jgi:hypothetical protein